MYVDIKVKEHERGNSKFSDNGNLVEVLATVIAKFGVRGQVFEKVLEYEKEAMTPT